MEVSRYRQRTSWEIVPWKDVVTATGGGFFAATRRTVSKMSFGIWPTTRFRHPSCVPGTDRSRSDGQSHPVQHLFLNPPLQGVLEVMDQTLSVALYARVSSQRQ